MQYDEIVGGSYDPYICELWFYPFEAEDSGDWKVVVAINGSESEQDEFIFTDVCTPRQGDVRIEDPSTGDRNGMGKIEVSV